MTKMKTMNFRIEEDKFKQIEEFCEKHDMTISKFIREAIEKELIQIDAWKMDWNEFHNNEKNVLR